MGGDGGGDAAADNDGHARERASNQNNKILVYLASPTPTTSHHPRQLVLLSSESNSILPISSGCTHPTTLISLSLTSRTDAIAARPQLMRGPH
jgi:hypothetical protein